MTTEGEESNRRSGMLLDSDFDVFGEQKQADEEMSKAAVQGTKHGLVFKDFHGFL